MARISRLFPCLMLASISLSACAPISYSMTPLIDIGASTPPPQAAEWKPYRAETPPPPAVDPAWRSAAARPADVAKTSLPPVPRVDPVDPSMDRQSVSDRIAAVKSGKPAPSMNDGWTAVQPKAAQPYTSRPVQPKTVKVDIDQPWMVRNVAVPEQSKVIDTIKLAVDNGSSSYTDLSGKTFLAKSTGTPIDGPCKDVKVSVSANGEPSSTDFRYAQVCSIQ